MAAQGRDRDGITDMRMALSAHLEGVLNGTFLVALGAGWGHIGLPGPVAAVARWTLLYGTHGTYGNWLFITLGAAMGTAAANPILSRGDSGSCGQERFVLLGFRGMRYAFLTSVVLILAGLSRREEVRSCAS